MGKTNYDYASKQAFRQRLVNFVARHYEKDARRELRYVCLPGYDDYHRTSLEIKQIVDPLGIPRENVTGLEIDERTYGKIKNARLGIDLRLLSEWEFFSQTKEKFDIINLDYTGMINEKFIDMLNDHIFRRQILSNRGVFSTTFYGSRDKRRIWTYSDAEFDYTLDAAYRDAITSAIKDWRLPNIEEFGEPIDRVLKKRMDEFELLSLDKLRDEIKRIVIMAAYQGRSISVLSDRNEVDPDNRGNSFRFLSLLKSKGLEERHINFAILRRMEPYVCEDLESYKYVSDDGSPMISDIFFFKTHPEWFSSKDFVIDYYCPESCANFFLDDSKLVFCDHVSMRVGKFDLVNPVSYENGLVKRNLAQANYVDRKIRQSYILSKKQRHFLGSSAKPIISKDEAREFLSNGISSDEILRNYRGITKQQLAALKAWKTMKSRKINR